MGKFRALLTIELDLINDTTYDDVPQLYSRNCSEGREVDIVLLAWVRRIKGFFSRSCLSKMGIPLDDFLVWFLKRSVRRFFHCLVIRKSLCLHIHQNDSEDDYRSYEHPFYC